MDLSLVTVNWHGGQHLERLLESVRSLAEELEEVIVVDNASDESPPEILSSIKNARWIALDVNLGFAGAANRGVGLVRSPFALLVNPDVRLHPDSVRKLYRTIRGAQRAAVVCGPLLGADGAPQSFQLRPLPTPFRILREVLFLRRSPEASSLEPDPVGPVPVEQPAAAYWLIRKSAWLELGGMDERFHPAWFEDVDFCRRAANSNLQLLYQHDAPATHHGGASLEHLDRKDFLEIYYRNLLKYLKKHHPQAYPWLVSPVLLGKWLRKLGLGGPPPVARASSP